MFLRRLNVSNCRSIREAELDFASDNASDARKWTILVGENGTGKSTLLKAAALLLSGSDSLPYLLGEPGTWVRDGDKSCRISAELQTKKGERRDISLEIENGASLRQVLSENTENLAMLDDAISHAEQNYFVVGYGPHRYAGREGLSFGSKKRAPSDFGSIRAESVQTLFDRTAAINPLESWAMSLDYRRGAVGLDTVRDALDALLPGVQFDEIDRDTETLWFRTPDGRVELDRLSDGYQNVAAWIGDLLYRVTESFAHFTDPLSARGVLLIDEIDAHLHPTWQRQLKAYLDEKLPNLQIIATTHSALTLQQFSGEEAFALKRGTLGVELQSLGVDPSHMMLHQLYELAFRIGSLDSVALEDAKSLLRRQQKGDAVPEEELRRARKLVGESQTVLSAKNMAIGNEALEGIFSQLETIAGSSASRRGGVGESE